MLDPNDEYIEKFWGISHNLLMCVTTPSAPNLDDVIYLQTSIVIQTSDITFNLITHKNTYYFKAQTPQIAHKCICLLSNHEVCLDIYAVFVCVCVCVCLAVLVCFHLTSVIQETLATHPHFVKSNKTKQKRNIKKTERNDRKSGPKNQ